MVDRVRGSDTQCAARGVGRARIAAPDARARVARFAYRRFADVSPARTPSSPWVCPTAVLTCGGRCCDARARAGRRALTPSGWTIGREQKWLWALAAIPPVVAVATTVLAPQPRSHWVEHLRGAAVKAAQLALLLALVTMLGWRSLRVLLLIAFAVAAVGIVIQTIGDAQVAHSIWATTGDPGYGPGYAQGQDRGGLGDLLVLGGGLAWAVIVGVTRRAPPWLAVVAAVLVVIPPPFFWPAMGILIVVLVGLTSSSGLDARSRRGHRHAEVIAPTET
jgi:hypothetical protein